MSIPRDAGPSGNLRTFIERNRAGEAVAVPSICSAHPDVIAASALLAASQDVPMLVEATSNQVNQFGGYTGMQAADFIGFIHGISDAAGLPRSRIIFGGDHLGPQAWRHEDASTAMEKAGELVRSFVRAGFTKIHLDCSEGCKGEPAQVSDTVSAERSATLARICEENAADPESLLYIVGTEVPPPGGARADEGDHGIVPTSAASARATLAEQRQHFERQVSADAWRRVIGLVVQPGVEFGAADIHHFDTASPDDLSPVLADHPHLAFEAHSTDYQHAPVFPELARRHFAILKVGPALTFAYRQAVYALDDVASWYGHEGPERIPAVMEALMLANPGNWAKHYSGSDDEVRRLRHFGYADRIRYYWAQPQAQSCVTAIMDRLSGRKLDLPLLQQYFAPAVIERARGLVTERTGLPQALIYAQIQEALLPYFAACPPGPA